MKSIVFGVLLSLTGLSAGSCARAEALPPIIVSGTGYIREYDLSSDNKRLTWTSEANNQRRIYVRGLRESAVTALPFVPGLSGAHWSADNRHIYALADHEGDEKHHVLVFDADQPTLPPQDLTPFPGKKAFLADTNNPNGSALIGLNLADDKMFGLYRVTPEGGPPVLVDPARPRHLGWMTTLHGALFGRMGFTPDGHVAIETRLSEKGKWNSFTLPGSKWRTGNVVSGATEPLADGSGWFLMRGEKDAATPQRIDLVTGKVLEALPSDGTDIDRVLFTAEGKPLLIQTVPGYPSIRLYDEAFRKALETVPLPLHSYITATSSDVLSLRFLLTFMSDSGEENIVYLDRTTSTAQILFHQGPPLAPNQLPKTVPITLPSRDKLTLHGYVTLPVGVEPSNLPTVVMVHGGPWMRDVWGFDPVVTALALQGYAVIRINFRGSGGFGRAFEDAGASEWGGKMQDDVTDATCWAVRQGVADPTKLAIMGGSYGGYSALMGLIRTPKLFAAAIEQDGPTDLPSFLTEMPSYTSDFKQIILDYIGTDPKLQRERSPLEQIDKIERPLLAVQGQNDPRIRASQLQMLEKAMKAANKDITTLYFADEGHGVSHEASFLAYMNSATNFLREKVKGSTYPSAIADYCN